MENIAFKEKLEKMFFENTIQGQNLKKFNKHFGEENIKKLPNYLNKMISQEQYLELEAKIREDLPRLLEPKEGCWLLMKGYENIKFKIIHRRAKEFIVDDYKGHKPINYRNSVFEDYFEIIGHDIMLNDVFEIIKNKQIAPHNIFIFWDFSKPKLKDQSDKVKEFLYKLYK